MSLGIWVSPLDAFTLVPAALLLAMVPISLARGGTQGSVFIQAFSLAGVTASDALALSVLYELVGLITGLLGGVVGSPNGGCNGSTSKCCAGASRVSEEPLKE